jgi:hypothetical protein
LNLVGGESGETDHAATQGHMLELDAVFVKKAVEQRGIEMNETAGDRASADAGWNRRFADFWEIGISVNSAAK